MRELEPALRGWLIVHPEVAFRALVRAYERQLAALANDQLALPAPNVPRKRRTTGDDLHDDVLRIVASYADSASLARMRRVSRPWATVANDERRWAALLKAEFGVALEALTPRPACARAFLGSLVNVRRDMLLAEGRAMAQTVARLRAMVLPLGRMGPGLGARRGAAARAW